MCVCMSVWSVSVCSVSGVCVVCMSVWSVMCVCGVYVSVECDVCVVCMSVWSVMCVWCVCQCGV